VAEALVVVDYDVDFVAPDGRLTCGPAAQAIDGAVAAWIRRFLDRGGWVVAAIDLHEPDDPYHPESRLFPPHNLRGTPGRALYGETGRLWEALSPEVRAARTHWIDKTCYSAFAGTDLDVWLRRRGVTDLCLVGVCTDICVLHTAIDAYNRGYRLTVPRDAVASFHEEAHRWALDHMERVLGASIV